jgi:mRNA interferase MazF
MEKFIKGNVVVIPFPFSDLSGAKLRPALVITNMDGEDILLCQITSKQKEDKHAIEISSKDFEVGNLPLTSFVRCSKIFTADREIIKKVSGKISKQKMKLVTDKIIAILEND